MWTVCVRVRMRNLMSFDLLLAHNDSGMRKLMEHHLCFRPIGSLSDESKVHARLLPWLRLAGWIVKWMMNELRDELLCSIILHHMHMLHTHCTVTQRPHSVPLHWKNRKPLTDHQKTLLTLSEKKTHKWYMVMRVRNVR